MDLDLARQLCVTSGAKFLLIAVILLGALFAVCGSGGVVEPDSVPAPPAGPADTEFLVPPENLPFRQGTLDTTGLTIINPTTLSFGPDGRLYVGQEDGAISALTLEGQTVTDVETIAPPDRLGNVLGIAVNLHQAGSHS